MLRAESGHLGGHHITVAEELSVVRTESGWRTGAEHVGRSHAGVPGQVGNLVFDSEQHVVGGVVLHDVSLTDSRNRSWDTSGTCQAGTNHGPRGRDPGIPLFRTQSLPSAGRSARVTSERTVRSLAAQ